jgi:eukaryotic-like serine/threonine-protein kinase
LYGLGLKDGKMLWQFKTKGQVHATAAVSNGIAYISGCDGVLRAIRIADGKQVYEVITGSYTGASPAIVDDRYAFFGTYDNDVHAYDLKTKQRIWRYENKARQFPFYSSAAVTENKVVLGGRDKIVHCFQQLTGKELWSFATRARVESSPVVSEGRVYIGSNDGRFYVLDFNTGAKIWEYQAGEPLSASPAVAEGRIVIGSQDGKLFCFGA